MKEKGEMESATKSAFWVLIVVVHHKVSTSLRVTVKGIKPTRLKSLTPVVLYRCPQHPLGVLEGIDTR